MQTGSYSGQMLGTGRPTTEKGATFLQSLALSRELKGAADQERVSQLMARARTHSLLHSLPPLGLSRR